jgi:D-glycero-D-manno-heptose 1,7-bisphosphate phosphatase
VQKLKPLLQPNEPHLVEYAKLHFAKLVIFDRDQTLIFDKGYTFAPEDLIFLEGALEAIVFANSIGAGVAIATNQSGVGRGLFSLPEMELFHKLLVDHVHAKTGVEITAISACPHLPESKCSCRKPEPGLILSLLSKLGVAKEDAVFLGNSDTDLKAGINAGVQSFLASGEGLIPALKKWSSAFDSH